MRGTLDPVGPATLFGGAVGLVDLPTAQRLFGRAGRVDEIDVLLAAGGDRDAMTRRVQSLVAGAGRSPIPRRGSEGSPASSAVSARSSPSRACSASPSALSSCITRCGAPCCSAAARSPSPGRSATARAVVAAAILAEAGCFGRVGGLFGVVLAVGAARLAIDVVTGAVSVIWTRADQATVVPDVTDVGVALLVGVVSALVAALGPAPASARLDVVEQLRSTSTRRRAAVGGSTLLVGVGACALACLAFASAAIWETLGADLAGDRDRLDGDDGRVRRARAARARRARRSGALARRGVAASCRRSRPSTSPATRSAVAAPSAR